MNKSDLNIAAAIVIYQPSLPILVELLSALEQAEIHIFIFVNGPVDTAVKEKLETLKNATLICSDENQGQGIGLNRVISAAEKNGFENILLFDQDSTPSSSLPDELAECLEKIMSSKNNIAAIGPKLVPPMGENYKHIWYKKNHKDKQNYPENIESVLFLPTSGTLMSIKAWQDIGPFREDFFISNIDIEWSFRALDNNYRLICDKDITMIHRWGDPIENKASFTPQVARQSNLRAYYYFRNFTYCLRLSHFPLTWKISQSLRVITQTLFFLGMRKLSIRSFKLLGRSIASGMSARLGAAPGDIASD